MLESSSPARENGYARRTLAVRLAEEGPGQEARELLESLVADYPDDDIAPGLLGNVLLEQGLAPAALERLDRTLAVQGSAADLYFERAQALRVPGLDAQAWESWCRALELEPGMVLARAALLEAERAANRWAESIELAREGAQAHPDEHGLA